MPLSPCDVAAGPAYMIVGTRADGDRLALADARTPEEAEQLRALFASHLEGYTSITVERFGAISLCRDSTTPPPGC